MASSLHTANWSEGLKKEMVEPVAPANNLDARFSLAEAIHSESPGTSLNNVDDVTRVLLHYPRILSSFVSITTAITGAGSTFETVVAICPRVTRFTARNDQSIVSVTRATKLTLLCAPSRWPNRVFLHRIIAFAAVKGSIVSDVGPADSVYDLADFIARGLNRMAKMRPISHSALRHRDVVRLWYESVARSEDIGHPLDTPALGIIVALAPGQDDGATKSCESHWAVGHYVLVPFSNQWIPPSAEEHPHKYVIYVATDPPARRMCFVPQPQLRERDDGPAPIHLIIESLRRRQHLIFRVPPNHPSTMRCGPLIVASASLRQWLGMTAATITNPAPIAELPTDDEEEEPDDTSHTLEQSAIDAEFVDDAIVYEALSERLLLCQVYSPEVPWSHISIFFKQFDFDAMQLTRLLPLCDEPQAIQNDAHQAVCRLVAVFIHSVVSTIPHERLPTWWKRVGLTVPQFRRFFTLEFWEQQIALALEFNRYKALSFHTEQQGAAVYTRQQAMLVTVPVSKSGNPNWARGVMLALPLSLACAIASHPGHIPVGNSGFNVSSGHPTHQKAVPPKLASSTC